MEIGDLVKVIPNTDYVYTQGGQTGTIVHIYDSVAHVLFDQETCTQLGIDFSVHFGWTISLKYLEIVTNYSPIPKEQKVATRCKKLWNTSNWVKKNPHLAY